MDTNYISNNKVCKKYAKIKKVISVPNESLIKRFGFEFVDEDETHIILRCTTCGHIRKSFKMVGGEISFYKCRMCESKNFKKSSNLPYKSNENNQQDHGYINTSKKLDFLYSEEQRLLSERKGKPAAEYEKINSELNNLRMQIQKIEKDPEFRVEHILPNMLNTNKIPGIIEI